MNEYSKSWDYSAHASFYKFRPNYAERAMDVLVQYVRTYVGKELLHVADLGAGTGNLTKMLLERDCSVDAVEPCDAMRAIGEKATSGASNVRWISATGTMTTLADGDYDWVTWGSSFNVVDRLAGLRESYRLLKPGGFFSCLWNHRCLEDPIQEQVESIIIKHVPHYNRGVRREDQRAFLMQHADLFDDLFYREIDFRFHQTKEDYINGWKSVKNNFWDLQTNEGMRLFNAIFEEVSRSLPDSFDVPYTTKAWTLRKVA